MKYVIRGDNGLIFTDTEIDGKEEEIKYDTYQEANNVMVELQKSFKDTQLTIERG